MQDKKRPHGKLRLLYEINPLAFLMEKAGGAASNGREPILDIGPTELHHRTPIFMGNTELVTRVEDFIRQYD
jgi:fructose-1,6-bisphosphatase I